MSSATVECTVYGLRSGSRKQQISFDTGADLLMTLEGQVGPQGLSQTAADLVDLAAAVYEIERQLSGGPTNPPTRFELRTRLRNPQAWSGRAIQATANILELLGNASWVLDLTAGLQAPIPQHQIEEARSVTQIALLSGGVDSACGAATLKIQAELTQLVSFYTTHQKSLQRTIAAELDHAAPIQWHRHWAKKPGPGHSFYCRSFLFLALAAAVAESWNARTILQFENGILATAIPPAASWMMTKHSHPQLHSYAAELFGALFGGVWQVQNPFLRFTKRGCVSLAKEAIGQAKFNSILGQTETCWYHWSNRIVGGSKSPGVPCGVCIPCVLRRTIPVDEYYQYDLRQDSVKNDPKKGLAFRSYFGFLERIRSAESTEQFYTLLPAMARDLVRSGFLSLADFHQLFLTFSQEFMQSYGLESRL